MRYNDHLRVDIRGKEYSIPDEQMAWMHDALTPVADAIEDSEPCELWITLAHHMCNGAYHVAAKLKLPQQTLFVGDRDAQVRAAFRRCVSKLVRKVSACKSMRENMLDQTLVVKTHPR
jgi:hypothetical protein